jgi:hypothetical protein
VLEIVRVFATKWFARFARREGISVENLLAAIERAEEGSVDADLGGGVIKQRVARRGEGRSGGYRTIIAFRAGQRAVFVFGFAKSERENIDENELDVARRLAAKWLGADSARLAKAIAEGEIKEVSR